MHRILIATLLVALGMPTVLTAGQIPGTSTPVDALAAELPWDFSVASESTTEESPAVELTVWRFKSVEPYERTDEGSVYLRFSLRVRQFRDPADADAQFDAWVQQDPEFFGLTKSWARIFQRDGTLYRLDVPCMFSEENVDQIASSLTGAFPDDADRSLPAISCWCGRGCSDGEYSVRDGFRPRV